MRKAKVLYKDKEAGILTQHDDGSFTFRYHNSWIDDGSKPSVSLTLPKSIQIYQSNYLFPFFYNMLPEGTNKQVICRYHRIDADDYFGLLMVTAKTDSIGAVNVVNMDDQWQ
jgi:HipA-like protein